MGGDTREEQIAAAIERELRKKRTPEEIAHIISVRFGLPNPAPEPHIAPKVTGVVPFDSAPAPVADTLAAGGIMDGEPVDTSTLEDLVDQAMDLALDAPLAVEIQRKMLKKLARLTGRVGKEALTVLEREVLEQIADFRLRDPARLRSRAARKEARGNMERASELRAMADAIEKSS